MTEDLEAIVKARTVKSAEEVVSLYEKSYPKAISVHGAGIEGALTYV